MKQRSLKRAQIDPRFARFPLRVGRSRVDRFGVFAMEDIASGQKVIEYSGERVTTAEGLKRCQRVERLPKREQRVYLFWLSPRRMVDGAVGGSGAELINHSCDPNLRTRRIRGHIYYFSRRPIAKGEELTVDYRFPKKSARFECRCGSPNCRGTMNRT